MVTVDQNLTVTPTSLERDQPAFVFGPQYELHRYGDPDEKARTYLGRYTGTRQEYTYPNVVDVSKVDKGYTKLFGDDVVIQIDETPIVATDHTTDSDGVTKLTFTQQEVKNRSAGDTYLVTTSGGSSSDGDPDDSFLAKVVKVDKENGLMYIDQVIQDGLSVSMALVLVSDGVEFQSKNEKEGQGYWWEQKAVDPDGDSEEEEGVVVYAGLQAVVRIDGEDVYRNVLSADLYLTYRELVTSFSDTLHSVTGASEVSSLLGAVSPDNPLAMGVYMACLNAATDDGDEAPPVYFMAVPTDNLDGYNKVLERASLTDRVYVLAPTTRDGDVLEAVRSHVLDMSVKTVKQWRIAVVSSEVPRGIDVLDADMNHGDYFVAIANPSQREFKVVKSSQDPTGNQDVRFRSTVVPGDIVRFNFTPDPWDNTKEAYDKYVVESVVNNYTLKLVKGTVIDTGSDTPGPSGWTSTAGRIEVYHPYTRQEEAEQVAKDSGSWASRRMYNVFPPEFSFNGVDMTGEFAACAVAGLISGTEPQQPITNVTVRGIDDIPLIYMNYSKADLDLIASGGTFIVCQDLPNSQVYVRHQISTAYPDGNLNTAELSVTKNVDNISYAFAEAFEPYYGKYNISDDLIATLWNIGTTLIDRLAGTASVYGPQLIAEDTEILYIRQNELLKDHVDVGVRLGVPYPCNNIDIVLTV